MTTYAPLFIGAALAFAQAAVFFILSEQSKRLERIETILMNGGKK